MNRLHNLAIAANDKITGAMDRRPTEMATEIHVLSVGPVDRGCMVHDALLNGPKFHLSIATDCKELWRMQTQESIQVAILHDALSEFETEAACRLIRRRWLDARILVESIAESNLEDALYDDRVAPNVSSEALFATIERLAGGVHA
ncbi:MAG: hypothetical protein ABSF70_18305 [Terracidiphilus sp.]|jgi:hypothetical protein